MMRWSLLCCAALAALTSATLAADEETHEVVAQDIKLNVPAKWKQQQVSNALRLAQFAIEPAEGDMEIAEMVVSGPFGGSVSENVKRWIDQFQAEGREAHMTQGESEQGKYIFVELSGTYNKPDGPPIMRKTKPAPDYRMAAVMLMSKAGGNYFLKFTGPAKTVSAGLPAFRKSFGGDASKETKFEF